MSTIRAVDCNAGKKVIGSQVWRLGQALGPSLERAFYSVLTIGFGRLSSSGGCSRSETRLRQVWYVEA